MATILKEYPRLFTYGKGYYRVDLRHKNYQGKKKTKDFSNEDDARKFRDEFRATLTQGGFNAVAPIQSPRLDKLDKQCAIWGRNLEDAVKIACDYWFEQKALLVSPLMSELLDKWVESKKTSLKDLRKDSINGIKNYAGYFKAYFGDMRIKQVDEEKVIEYLKSRDMKPQTRYNNANYLSQFFNWAIHKNYHNANPASKVKKEINIPRKTTLFYEVEQAEDILRNCLEPDNQKAIGIFALGLFAGCRPEEASELNWNDHIKWNTKEIFIPAHIAKTKRDRQFIMSDTLYSWLTILREKGLPLVPQKNLRRITEKVTKKLSFKFIKDGLRHTFTTFEYKRNPNYEVLESIMGNSKSVIQKHYQGVIDAAEIEKFFSLTPEYVKEHNPKEKIARYKKALAAKEEAAKLKLPEGVAKIKVNKYLDELKNKQTLVAA